MADVRGVGGPSQPPKIPHELEELREDVVDFAKKAVIEKPGKKPLSSFSGKVPPIAQKVVDVIRNRIQEK